MSQAQEKTVRVPNIICGHCVGAIEREVADVPGVRSVEGDAEARRVTISWDPDVTDWVAIEETMKDIHYPPEEDAGS